MPRRRLLSREFVCGVRIRHAKIQQELMLEGVELEILETLNSEEKAMKALFALNVREQFRPDIATPPSETRFCRPRA